MKVEAKIQKWGNGLALRVSGVMRDIPHFEAGNIVEVDIDEKGFSVVKLKQNKNKLFPFTEVQLLENITPELAHADLLAEPLDSEFLFNE